MDCRSCCWRGGQWDCLCTGGAVPARACGSIGSDHLAPARPACPRSAPGTPGLRSTQGDHCQASRLRPPAAGGWAAGGNRGGLARRQGGGGRRCAPRVTGLCTGARASASGAACGGGGAAARFGGAGHRGAAHVAGGAGARAHPVHRAPRHGQVGAGAPTGQAVCGLLLRAPAHSLFRCVVWGPGAVGQELGPRRFRARPGNPVPSPPLSPPHGQSPRSCLARSLSRLWSGTSTCARRKGAPGGVGG